MSQIQITNLTFSYEENYDLIFDNVSFQMDTDWKLGFTGRNGRGKTTFLKLLMGEYEYSGNISANVPFDYFPFAIADKRLDTMEVVTQADPEHEFWKVLREFSKLRIPEEVLFRPFDTLSNGEQTKVLLAVLFAKEGNFLLIDEPTNHLDQKGRRLVSEYLNSKKGFILVSHDRRFLDACVDHILAINKSDIEVQKGNFSTWYQNKQMRDAFEQGENERLQKDIKKLNAAARQTREWGDAVEATKIGHKSMAHEKNIDTRAYIGEKSRRMQQRRKNLEHRQERAIEEKSFLLKNLETVESLKLNPLQYPKEELLALRDVSLFYEERQVCSGINLTLCRGERISLQGSNGSGKSSILKRIMGEDIACSGTVRLGSGLILSYVPQSTAFLKGSVLEYARKCGIEESLFLAILRKLDFPRVQFEKDLSNFSEGQKKKVLLGRSLCQPAHLYLWDEPLNFMDVFSRMQVEELLLIFEPTLLFVEHDQEFAERIATRTVTL